jgi:hypothetical protein
VRRGGPAEREEGRLKDKYDYGVWKDRGVTVRHQPDFEPQAALKTIADYREAPRKEGIRFIKTDHTRTILTLPLRGQEGAAGGRGKPCVCLKHFRYRGFLQALKDLFRTHRGRRSWMAGIAFAARGIPTGRPLALVEVRKRGLLRESFLLMEDLSRFSGVHCYVLNNFNGASSRGADVRKRFAEALAAALSQLHKKDIYHGDLKSSNILVEEVEDGWKFHYIDLDGVRIGRKVSLQQRAKNLAQIETSTPDCMTRADRMSFFQRYLRSADMGIDDKAFMDMVIRHARKRTRVW